MSGVPLSPIHLRKLARGLRRAGLSQTELAAACDCSQASINRVMTGQQAPSFDLLCRICGELDISFAWNGRLVLFELQG